MSSGEVHTRDSLRGALLSVVIGNSAGVYTNEIVPVVICTGMAVGLLMGTVITPDLDVDRSNVTYTTMGRFGWWWRWLWKSYSIGFKHRSLYSHMPLIGTLYRFVYMLFPVTINIFADQQSGTKLFLTSLWSQLAAIPTILIAILLSYYVLLDGNFSVLIFVMIGLMVSDTLHFIKDNI